MCRPQFPFFNNNNPNGNGNSDRFVFPDEFDKLARFGSAGAFPFNTDFANNAFRQSPFPNNPFLQNVNAQQNLPSQTNQFQNRPFTDNNNQFQSNQFGGIAFPNNPFFQSNQQQGFPSPGQLPSPPRQPAQRPTPRPVQRITTASPQQSTPATTTVQRPMTTRGPQFFSCYHDCTTTGQYNPVCGSDGQSYHNDQKLQCTNNCGRRVANDWTGEEASY